MFDGLRIASIHTIIRMYMCMVLSPRQNVHFSTLNLECLVNTLALLQNKARTVRAQRHKKLFQDVVAQCYGASTGLVTLRKNRLLRLAK